MKKVFLTLCLVIFSWTSHAQTIEILQQALEEKSYTDAWAIAQDMENDWLGNEQFDFYYGIAAIHAQMPEHAVMAFERVLMTNPNSQRVLLELGRAHFGLGNFELAKNYFQKALQLGVPPQVEQNIQLYFAAIENQEKNLSTYWGVKLGMTIGHDTNINSATSADSFEFILGNFVFNGLISDENQKDSDNFAQLNADLIYRQPLTQQEALFANVGIKTLGNETTSRVNQDEFNFNAGYQWSGSDSLTRAFVTGQSVYLQSDHAQYVAGVAFDYLKAINSQWSSMFFSQISWINYPNAHEADTRFASIGAGISWSAKSQPVTLLASVTIGDEHASDIDSNGRSVQELRLGAQYRMNENWSANVSISGQYSHYDDAGAFTELRQEWQYQSKAALDWSPDQKLSVSIGVEYTDTHSNLDLYDYDRMKAFVSVQYLID